MLYKHFDLTPHEQHDQDSLRVTELQNINDCMTFDTIDLLIS